MPKPLSSVCFKHNIDMTFQFEFELVRNSSILSHFRKTGPVRLTCTGTVPVVHEDGCLRYGMRGGEYESLFSIENHNNFGYPENVKHDFSNQFFCYPDFLYIKSIVRVVEIRPLTRVPDRTSRNGALLLSYPPPLRPFLKQPSS